MKTKLNTANRKDSKLIINIKRVIQLSGIKMSVAVHRLTFFSYLIIFTLLLYIYFKFNKNSKM